MSTELRTNPRDETPTAGEQAAGTTGVAIRKPADFERLLGQAAAPAIHNFEGDIQAQWRMTALATNGVHGNVKDLAGREIKLRYFYVHAVTINGRTPGEIVDAIRTVLFDTEGNSWAFASEGIAKSLAQLVEALGMGPWADPPLIKIVEGRTRAGLNFYSIVPA